MKNVGDYEWLQVSQWSSTPKNCVEKYKTIETGLSGKVVCRYYLTRVAEKISDTHVRFETVKDLDGVPDEILKCNDATICVVENNKTVHKIKI